MKPGTRVEMASYPDDPAAAVRSAWWPSRLPDVPPHEPSAWPHAAGALAVSIPARSHATSRDASVPSGGRGCRLCPDRGRRGHHDACPCPSGGHALCCRDRRATHRRNTYPVSSTARPSRRPRTGGGSSSRRASDTTARSDTGSPRPRCSRDRGGAALGMRVLPVVRRCEYQRTPARAPEAQERGRGHRERVLSVVVSCFDSSVPQLCSAVSKRTGMV